jgi:leader peptidase (prepilin peptidase) / N-methyltransferase
MDLIVLIQKNLLAFTLLSVLVGLLVGSFLNVVIYRTPVMLLRRWREECRELNGDTTALATPAEALNLLTPRSRCPHCGHAIRALENIPVLSWLVLHGKCSVCQQPISARYPAVETLTAVLTAVTAWHFGYGAVGLAAIALVWVLIALSFIDIDHHLLPDVIVLPALWAGLLLNLFGVFTSLHSAVIGAAAGYLSLWLVYHLFKLITGKEGMGYGDFKLLAVFGAWLGWQYLLVIILLSSFVGAVVGLSLILFQGRDRAQPLPFGPYLAVAGWVALLWGNEIIHRYLQFARL